MSVLQLARRQAFSHPVRTLLTVGAVAVAMFLFCFLRSIVTSLDAAVSQSASDRIITASAVSLFQSLPVSYMSDIGEVTGVESVSRFSWFGGRYQSEENFFAQFACDPEILLDQYPEIVMPPEQAQTWIGDRRGAIVGVALAEKFGWSVGDTVPLIGTIYPRVDGSTWDFNIRGIYKSMRANVDEMTMYFHWSMLDETLEAGDSYGPRGTSVYIVRMEEGFTAAEVSQAIDKRYELGPQVTRTQSEAAFQAGFVAMLGNLPTFLGMIGAAVLVAVLFGVVNTMTLAARERVRSTGIMQSLGFPAAISGRLYLLEGCGIMLLGGAIGVGIAWWTQPVFRQLFGTQIPMFAIEVDTYVQAAMICLAIGFIAGLIPAWRSTRMRAAEAMRRGT